MIIWIVIVVLAAVFAVGIWTFSRWAARWEMPPPESAEAKEAAARLESRGRTFFGRRR